MGDIKLLLCAAVVIVACIESSQAAGCPPPDKVYDYSKKESCRGDGDCKHGKICCLNPARVRSCTNPVANGGSGDKGSQSGEKCENVTCQPYEVCKPDPKNPRRRTCQRP